MKIVTVVKEVPDLVEELEIDASGTSLNKQWLKYVTNEFDDQALEEALLLKEEQGGEIIALAINGPEVDQVLYTCLAKGADRAIKIDGDFGDSLDSHSRAKLLSQVISGMEYDLIMTGVQSADDIDGQTGVLLAAYLGLPHVSVVTGVHVDQGARTATVFQEYAGGVMGELELDLPAVLGIQAARQPPRYVPISRLRQAMMSGNLETSSASLPTAGAGIQVRRLSKPESGSRAEMIEGSTEQIVERIVAILNERGFIKSG